jgi:ABC-type nickel/cobalt efflux system permease component RcnA/ABC-type uncharacterized transport system substrate-binding protein
MLAGVLCATPALAHPHIFIDAKAVISFDDTGAVKSIHNAWTFDEIFSSWQIQGLDTNGDGNTSTEEMQELGDDNMTGLAEYQYYTFAGERSDENLSLTNGRNPRFVYANGRSTLDFDVDFAAPYHIKDTLEIAINDPEYYVAITFADASAVTLVNAPAGCAVSMDPPGTMSDDLAAELSALPADVTELPPDLAAALRGVQGAILVKCPPTAAAAESAAPVAAPALEPQTAAAAPAPAPETALDAATAVAETSNALPFGGPPAEPGLALPKTGFFGWVADQQRSFYQMLSTALARLKQDANAFWVLGGLSFLYGMFHAAGPGHGKVVISSYVLASERQLRRGILLSFASALVQSLVAIAFALVAGAVLNMTATAMGEVANWIGILSYGLVALLGLWLIARKLFGWGHSHHHHVPASLAHKAHTRLQAGEDAHGRRPGDPHYGHDHGPHDHHRDHHDDHDHDEHDHHHHVVMPAQTGGNWREQLGVVLAAGLRPCSGALIVLAFALSQGLLPAGIVAVLLMGLGTGITVAILASLAVGLKGLALSGGGALAAGIVWWAELAGAVLVLAFGIVLLIASL